MLGVNYGNYDLNRLLVTLTVSKHPETQAPLIAIKEGGMHAAEALIIARYLMFTQVYFHHTRRAYDYHIAEAMKYHDEINDVIEIFGDMSARELELRSTVIYFSKEKSMSKESMINCVKEIKPHFTLHEIEYAIDQLTNIGIL